MAQRFASSKSSTYLMLSTEHVALVDLLVQRHGLGVARLLAEHTLQLVELCVLIRACLLRFFVHLYLCGKNIFS